ncbi:glycosyltransferase involved in cell wall biosynthesis [Elusimicrobium posterum]|uniref:glycosyltransferase n=1 Tax=Elusimicrobium posterum TaxID=3116653 RepID=UPI003C71F04B
MKKRYNYSSNHNKNKKYNNIRVLYIITRLDGGGAQKSVLHSAQNLGRGVDVYLAASPGGPLYNKAQKILKKNLFTIKSFRHKLSINNLFHDLRATWQILKIILKVKPHIIHTNCPKAGVLGRTAALFYPKAKVIHTFHGFGFSVIGGIKRYIFYSNIEKVMAWFSDKLIFVSKANMSEAQSLGIGNAKKNILIRAGAVFEDIKPGFDKEKKKESLGIQNFKHIVLGIGNFKPLKNPKDFVFIAKHVVKKLPDTCFLYAGTGGSEEHRTKTLARKFGLKKNLIFLGLRHDIRELLDISDLYISTSLREGLPLALLEALGAGVPAICYEADGTSEVLKNNENGFIFGQSKKESMSAKIIEIFKNPAQLEALKKGTSKLDKYYFSADKTVRDQTNLYKNILVKKIK